MTKKLTLEFLQFNKPKRNGDRATIYTDCYDFEIKLHGLVLHKFSQYQPFWESISSYREVLLEATKYAENLADTLEIERPKLVTMVKKVIEETQWVPEKVWKDPLAGCKDPGPAASTSIKDARIAEEDRLVEEDRLAEKGHRENRDNG